MSVLPSIQSGLGAASGVSSGILAATPIIAGLTGQQISQVVGYQPERYCEFACSRSQLHEYIE